MKTGWTFIERAAWEKQEKKEGSRSAMLFDVSFSPYDIPTAVRGAFDEASRKFIIEFRYVWPEEGQVRHAHRDEHVEFVIGKVSGRLLEIHIDVESAGVDFLMLQSQAISAVNSLSADESRYGATKEAIQEFFKRDSSGAFQAIAP